MQYMVEFDRSDIWLDRTRKIEDNDGWKREVSYFSVIPDVRGKSVEILMWGKIKDVYYSLMVKRKKMKLYNGKVYVSICGKDYQIGTYTIQE